VLVMRPDTAFQGGNPLLLTIEGEFVVKNLVLIAAGLAVEGGTVRHIRKEQPLQECFSLSAALREVCSLTASMTWLCQTFCFP
jgi:hypothetical protein